MLRSTASIPENVMEAATAHAPRARIWSLQPDALLCRAGAHGNETAFDELHRRYHRQISAFVFHLLGGRHRREDTEEIVQDTFARAFTKVRERQFEGSFRAWLYVIARNRAVDLMRADHGALVPLDDEDSVTAPRARALDEPVAAAESREDLAWLVHAIAELPERQRSALLMRELGGLSHEAIAQNLETSTGSVRQLIGRGRDGVRRAAESDVDAPRSLRRGLLDAAPWVPAAALGGGVVAGTGAGAGGVFAIGKLAAALATVIAIAGTAATLEGPVNGAENRSAIDRAAKVSALTPGAGQLGSTRVRGQADRPSDSRGATTQQIGVVETPRDEDARSDAATGSGSSPRSEHRSAAEKQPATAPLEPVVELPEKVVDNVGSLLDGSKPVPEVVGDLTTDVLGTVEQTTKGLLDPLTSR